MDKQPVQMVGTSPPPTADARADSGGSGSPRTDERMGRARAQSDGSPRAKSQDGTMMSPHPAPTQDTYSTDLFRAFPKVCQKAKSGVQLCQAVASFVTERASAESNYAQSLLKLAQNAKVEDWAQQFVDCWTTVQEATEQLAQERWAFASTMQTSIVPGAKAFAAQQELQVHRLITEGTKVRWAQQQMITSMEKAKEKYDRKCQEAAELTGAARKPDTFAMGDAGNSPAPESPDDISASKELTDKLTAGAGQLLTKMWDTTSSFGRNPAERQRVKLYNCLEEVSSAEKHYVQTVEYTNAQRLIFEREIKENLHAFQLTEEQRLEYLRDVLLRMQKAFISMFERSQRFVERMKESANAVNELADIEKGFQSLGSQEEVDVDRADLSNNPFFLRITHIQTMSDSGQQMIELINSVVTEFITIENRFSQSLRKLLRTHESGGLASPADLFGTSSSNINANFLADEGESMANGWTTARDQVKLLLEVHQEFRSLLAEPVSLSLSTMKTDYESVRMATQESFLKTHAALCNESAAHAKLHQKLEAKSREFAMTLSCMPGAIAINSSSSGVDTSQALELLRANASSFNEKERRLEIKLRHLAEEIQQLQTHVTDSIRALKQVYQLYIQEIEVFISTYMKNEQYRLQVSKNSLQSLAKAIDHMLLGGISVGNKALIEFGKIDPSSDITNFIRINRQPYERSKRIVPAYHGNDKLKEVMREYLASFGSSTSVQSEASGRISRRTSHDNYPALSIPTDDRLSSPEQSPRTDASSPANDQAMTANGSLDTDRDGFDEDKTGIEQNEDYDAQPLGVSDFQKKFKLDAPEQVVESYSCALYLSNFPFHGRLYLTRDRMCFSGWRDTIFVASFLEISSIDKKNTALIVPNAIELMVRKERVFFASFVFRDECFNCIQQLRSIKKETAAILADPNSLSEGELMKEEDIPVTDDEPRRRSSPTAFAAVAPSPDTATTSAATEVQASSSIDLMEGSDPRPASASDLPPSSTPAFSVPANDELLGEYDLLLDEEVPFSVETAYSTLWIGSDAFSRGLLSSGGATNLSLPAWEKKAVSYTAVSKPDNFDGSRLISYTTNKKFMVGPSAIPTLQTQRYLYTPGSRLIVSVTTCVSDVPYCDYFRVEHRWVFSATKKRGVCLAQVGLRVQWLKSTWLKKQIEGTTVSEAKDSVKTWLSAAIEAAEQQKTATGTVAPAPVSTSSPTWSSPSSGMEKGEQPVDRGDKATITTVSASTSVPQAYANTETTQPPQLRSAMQLAIIVCALMIIYTMYRVCATMNQMQVLTRETLLQQREQQAVLKELLDRLRSIEARR